jgi:hypothetical protein
MRYENILPRQPHAWQKYGLNFILRSTFSPTFLVLLRRSDAIFPQLGHLDSWAFLLTNNLKFNFL